MNYSATSYRASCFNHHCLTNTKLYCQVLHNVHKCLVRLVSSLPSLTNVYDADFSIRRPSFFMFRAELWSRSNTNPQSQRIVRIDKSFISVCTVPQQLQIWLDGNHLFLNSIFIPPEPVSDITMVAAIFPAVIPIGFKSSATVCTFLCVDRFPVSCLWMCFPPKSLAVIRAITYN